MPATPVLVFDGRCTFCRIWIDYWKQITGDRIVYAPYQEVADQYPQVPREAFTKAVHLIQPDGTFSKGAHAVSETLDKLWWYESVPGLAGVLEFAYGIVARHRDLFYQITRFTFGRKVEVDRFAATQWIFLKVLAVTYIAAFASLGTQVTALIGEQGLLPAAEFFPRILAGFGTPAYWAVPSLFWLGASDTLLRAGCWLGVALAIVLLLGRLERVVLPLLYALYLSYSLAGQAFMGFQWDALLLEAGFLAIFFGKSATQQRIVAWLYRLLVFRLYFLSGWVKLGSGDRTWRGFTALEYHYHTQPLPTIFAWYADKLAPWFQHASTAAVLGIEMGAPFLIFAPRCWRPAGAWMMLTLQALILLTGNYTFFNLLTIGLTLYLFDDRALEKLLRIRHRLPAIPSSKRARMAATWLAVLLLFLGAAQIYETTQRTLPGVLRVAADTAWPFQIVNSYGLFAVMTTTRNEIILEGSDDGERWQPYEFRYKPGELKRAPAWAAPHQPRLDWQLWFAALDDQRSSPWFAILVEKLLKGDPNVLALLASNPFPQRPPRYVRAMLYEYRFSAWGSAAWWQREPRGTYFPAVGLK